jgi:hypothetical protein
MFIYKCNAETNFKSDQRICTEHILHTLGEKRHLKITAKSLFLKGLPF